MTLVKHNLFNVVSNEDACVNCLFNEDMDGRKRRGEKVLLVPWLNHHLDEGTFGNQLRWSDKNNGKFVIRWKHKSSCEWKADNDLLAPVAWAAIKGKVKPTDDSYHQRCKTNFRCALRSKGIKRIGRSSCENTYQFPAQKQIQNGWLKRPIVQVNEDILPDVNNDVVLASECDVGDTGSEGGIVIPNNEDMAEFISESGEIIGLYYPDTMRNGPIIDDLALNDSGYEDMGHQWLCVDANMDNFEDVFKL